MPIANRLLMSMAAFVIVIAGMRAAGDILVPFLLSLFIAIIFAPVLFWAHRRGIPNILTVLVVLVTVLAIATLLATFVGASAKHFSDNLPFYQERLAQKTSGFLVWLESLGMSVSADVLSSTINPGKAMGLAAQTLKGISSVLTNIFMILMTVVFILLEATALPKKMAGALNDPQHQAFARLDLFMGSLNRYLAIKTLFSLLTGITIGLWLALLGVDYPILWGLLAFLLNYVPNIGSIIAAIPACLLALVQLGPGSAILGALGYVSVNIAFGSILEPRLVGQGLGLSTLVVWLSLVFWGWVLGPVGMLLSVPLTMVVKIALESHEDTKKIALFLGPAPKEIDQSQAKETVPSSG